LNHLDKLSKNTQISNVMQIPAVGAELFQADGQTEKKITKLILAFRNSAKRP